MSVNKNLPHVLVIPEDDANRQLAMGFALEPSVSTRRIQVLPEAGGWTNVIAQFRSDHLLDMERTPQRYIVLLIDFDSRFASRMEQVREAIPAHVSERVFVLGALDDPETLRRAKLGSFEAIGMGLAKDCREETTRLWGHELLAHNEPELNRLRASVRPFLFPA